MNFVKLEGLPVFTSHISRHWLANFAYVRVLRTLRHVLAVSASRLRCIFDGRRYVLQETCQYNALGTEMAACSASAPHTVRRSQTPCAPPSSLQLMNLLFWKCKVRRTLTEPAGVLNCLIRHRHTNTLTPCLYVCVKNGVN